MPDEELAATLARRMGGRVVGLRRLSEAASGETWRFDLDGRPLVLRRHPAPAPPVEAMAREAHLHRAAADTGVPVPAIVDVSDDPTVLGSPFIVMERVEGETVPGSILGHAHFAALRPRLARQCGEILALVHAIPLDAVPGLVGGDPVTQLRSLLHAPGPPRPGFEAALRWLEANRPPAGRTSVLHGNFRLANLVVGDEGVRAVLRWELAHAGDPLEDLGWLCLRSWRLGRDLPVGGFGSYEELLGGYGAGQGEAARLRWWEVAGNLRWGAMCLARSPRATAGGGRADDQAGVHHEVAEVEKELAALIGAGSGPDQQPLP